MPANTVYMSYSYQDRHIAQQLVRDLTNAGITVNYDVNILKTGQVWKDTLRAAIDRADAVIVLLSDKSVQSASIRDEIQYALRNKKPILPIMLDNVAGFLGELDLANVYASQINNISDYSKVINDIIDMVHAPLLSAAQSLAAEGFSNNAINAFMRMARTLDTAPTQSMVLHYDKDLDITDVTSIEDAMNNMAKKVVAEVNTFSDYRSPLLSQIKFIHVYSVTHPGSTDLVFQLTQSVQQILATPEAQAILIGLLTSIIYDVGKKQLINIKNRIGTLFAKHPETGKLEQIPESVNVPIPEPNLNEMRQNVEKIILLTPNPTAMNGEPAKYTVMMGDGFISLWETKTVTNMIAEIPANLTYWQALEEKVKQRKP